jgi:hypothetical protein
MRNLAALALVAATTFAALPARAADRDKEGYFTTGEGIRFKKVAFINVKVYDITSYAKELPSDKSKGGMIALDVDKKLSWKMLRTVDAEKIKHALREGFAKNGYTDTAKIDQLLSAFSGDLKEGTVVTIVYDAGAKKTTLYSDGKSTSVAGADFMKATWSLWFGNIDQPTLTDSLLKELK